MSNLESSAIKLERVLRLDSRLFYFILICVVSASLLHNSYAQTQVVSDSQVTFSNDLLNDPVAQDILKKIEQTKKMIEELKQKEYEENQAKENLEDIRDLSIIQLNQKLDEWERVWEKHSSKNAFERFVGEKPSFIHGVFWDQFEFKEQKVNAGRTAMNETLTNGGTMDDATNAYHDAAATQRIELVEFNSQSNVKHNLASYEEQQVFNSLGKVHSSPATQTKLSNFYTDYKSQPNYILANLDDDESTLNLDNTCDEGFVVVSRIVSGNSSCVDEITANKWISNGVSGITISNHPSTSAIKTNPGTQCVPGHVVVFDIAFSEYRCVLESVANDMMGDYTAEIHTLVDYALDKDKQKITEDTIYEINQKILQLNEEYDAKKSMLEREFNENIDHENLLSKQRIQEVILEYRSGDILTKEDVTKQISELRNANESVEKQILREKLDAMSKLELELKHNLLDIIQGYENNSNIDVDWNYLNSISDVVQSSSETSTTMTPVSATVEKNVPIPTKVSFSSDRNDTLILDNIGIINSIGQEFDEIKADQVLQVAADVTNVDDFPQNFAYVVEIVDDDGALIQSERWVTGTLSSTQTFNVSLSWMPTKVGTYAAIVSVGNAVDSVLQVAEIEINVHPEGNVSDANYCKNGHELLFKYSDNSPICATSNTASKLIKIGLAFD